MIDEATLIHRANQVVFEEYGMSADELALCDDETKEAFLDYSSEILEDMRYNCMKYFRPLDYQKKFFNINAKRKGLIAANRSGKTVSTCMEAAYHLTGLYPTWWRGKRFKGNIILVVLGESWQQVSVATQSEILGTSDASQYAMIGTGSIPKHLIDFERIGRTGRIAKEVHVKHVSGQYSTLMFRNYTQQRRNVQGFNAHVILIDEQPPEDIYSELSTRTANKQGIVICSFTPLRGFSALVTNFWENKEGHEHVRVKWDDVPEYDNWGSPLFLNEDRRILIGEMAPHEIGPRTEGIPMRGIGSVFTVSPIPTYNSTDIDFNNDTFHRLIAIDLASVNDKTVITLMYWNKSNNHGYIDHQYVLKPGEESKFTNWRGILTNPRYRDIPIVLPSDGNQQYRYTQSEASVREMLLADGLNVCDKSINAKFSMEKGSTNTISYGISQLNIKMEQQTLFINDTCSDLLKEMQNYFIDDKGNYKGKNDCIDSARYALIGCILGLAKPQHYNKLMENAELKRRIAQKRQIKINSLPFWKRTIKV